MLNNNNQTVFPILFKLVTIWISNGHDIKVPIYRKALSLYRDGTVAVKVLTINESKMLTVEIFNLFFLLCCVSISALKTLELIVKPTLVYLINKANLK